MEIYLIRHTTPDIEKGTCYGQADLNTIHSFLEEATCIQQHLPDGIQLVFSSPLKRCRQLAEHLFPNHSISFDDRLKEINCGEWELRPWNEIEQSLLKKWMDDFVNVCIPGGESYLQLYRRVVDFFETIPLSSTIAIVSHGGVIRSLLSHIERVALQDSFNTYSLRYGCVVKVERSEGMYRHQVLHNPVVAQEQHRPTTL
jgi:alpha-ribazole phosphatase